MYQFKETEQEISKFWKEKKIFEKLMKREGKAYFFLDGPPYANDFPHVGHIKNTVCKDVVIRMNFMKGCNVLFQPGFDTHGLPIENMVEKRLNLGSKKDIEKFGVANFMQECKKNAISNKDGWMNVYKKLGSLYFLKEPYLTYEDYYIESAWWAFAKMYKQKMVYKGEKPVMWCPHCETSLAGYEVTDSYKDVKDNGVYVLFKLKDSDDHLLVYTTTPWTLPANVAIAIAPKENYIKLNIDGRKLIICEEQLKKLSEIGFKYKILEKFKGKKLVGKKYEPLLNVPLQKELSKGKYGKAHEIVESIPLLKERVASKIHAKKKTKGKDLFEEFVTINTGTGMVHTAPGHGKSDYVIGEHYKLACVSPVDNKGYFIEEQAGFSGFVKDADKTILEQLDQEKKLFYQESIIHSYPLCWRCKSPLIFRLSEQLFFRVEEVKKIMEQENEKVSWYPDFAKDRFDKWVRNAEDWNISRQRYWGIPIPIWECECGEEIIVESKKELEKLSGKKLNDLHVVDKLGIKCKCGGQMNKLKGILDVWFDSGVAPWASLGYPHKNKELFNKHFPVTRINEAQDQIRGWFYSLMFCSAAVFKKAPYKQVSMVGWVVDKKGNKMSKSEGNIITGEQAINELGADILRYYFCWDIAPYELQKFNIEIAKKEIGKILNVLWNLKNLTSNKKFNKIDIEDKWIFSRMNSVMKQYKEDLENFELHTAMRNISDFILDDLSRRYIRMTRERDNGAVITYCMKEILRLLAPVIPFITEHLWQDLKNKKIVQEESVHLSSWPKTENKKINKKLEEDFEIVLQIIEKGLSERDKVKIGLKWPLANAVIGCNKKLEREFLEIIKNQLNLKNIQLKISKEINIELNTKLTSELESEGYAREISRQVQAFRKNLGLDKKDQIELGIFVENDLKKILEKQIKFIKERTNSKKIEINDDVTTKKERFKKKTIFKIKDKKGEIGIISIK